MFSKIFSLLYVIIVRLKYALVYYVLGGKSILHDMIYRRYNSVKLRSRPDQIAVVTGGERGIGGGLVKMLMECDMRVIIGCTSIECGEQMIRRIRDEGVTRGDASVLELDLKSLKSVRRFADEFYKRHKYANLLANNAGIMFGPYEETEDGFESQFSVNYLGHFLLTHLLLPAMKEASSKFTDNPRIVNVSSCTHQVSPEIDFNDIDMKNFYVEHAAYAQSKLCVLMSTKAMDRRFRESDSNIQAIAVHPGIVNTELFNGTLVKTLTPWVLTFFCKSIEEGATTVAFCCVDERTENAGGSYYSNCRRMTGTPLAENLRKQDELYNFSVKLIRQFLPQSE